MSHSPSDEALIVLIDENVALRARVAQLEALLKGVNAETGAEIETLRARVGQLEAALLDCKRYAEDHDDEWVPFRVDDALKDAPQ